jgi:hypothetical protein
LAHSGRGEKDTYSGQPGLDLTHYGVEFNIERQLTRALSAQLLGRWYKSDYPHAAVASAVASSNYDDGLVGAALAWRYGRSLVIRLRVNQSSHEVSAGNSGYHEARAFLTVGYWPNSNPEVQLTE